jgi:PiT family inorganic phosphate transporter
MRAIAVGLVLLMQAWAGANDGGNLAAPALGARALSLVAAFTLMCAGAVVGPLVLGTGVADTIVHAVVALPTGAVEIGVVGAMTGASASVLLAYAQRVPTSLSLAVVGGLVGSALAVGAPVHWGGVARVAAGLVAALVLGVALGTGAYLAARRLGRGLSRAAGNRLLVLESPALVVAALAYGANDAEKALGLLAWTLAPTALGRAGGHGLRVAIALVLASGAAWTAGALLGGGRVAASVGARVFRVRPLHALSAQAAAAVTVLGAALAGAPVSTTQTLDAALVGVAAGDGVRRVHWLMVRDMAVALGTAAPVAATLAFVATRLIGR